MRGVQPVRFHKPHIRIGCKRWVVTINCCAAFERHTQLLITLPPLFYLSIAFICDVIALYWWSRVFGCIDLYKARASSWVVWTRLWQDKVARLMSSLLRYRKHLKYFRPSFPLSPPVKRVPLAACHTASLFKNPQLYASQLRSENDEEWRLLKKILNNFKMFRAVVFMTSNMHLSFLMLNCAIAISGRAAGSRGDMRFMITALAFGWQDF